MRDAFVKALEELAESDESIFFITADLGFGVFDNYAERFPNQYLKDNKFWPPVSRVDNVYGDRNLVCSCPSLDSYREEAA